MKRMISYFILLATLMLACNLPSTATPTILPPPQDLTETPPLQPNVTCNNVSLFLDPALAGSFQCQTIPEASGADLPAFGVNPQYTEITLQGYVLADRFFTPHIDVFPVQRFTELLPGAVPQRVTALQALIGGGMPGAGALPLLPVFNAAQEFYAHYQVVPFASGSGIRYLTQYAQFSDPVNNHEMFYSYQGLTSDGRYWISAILPVSHPSLPENGDTPPGGQSFEEFSNNFTTYIADMTAQLNSQAASSFSPALSMLDALIASLQVQP